MKLKFLASGSSDCPLIRIYEFNSKEAYELRRIAIQLARGKATTVRLHEQTNITVIGDCELTLRQGRQYREVSAISSSKFEWVLSPAGWLQVSDLVRPFSRQWVPMAV